MPRNPNSRKRGWHRTIHGQFFQPRRKREPSHYPKGTPENPEPKPALDSVVRKRLAEISERARQRHESKRCAARIAQAEHLPDNETASVEAVQEFEEELQDQLHEQDGDV